MVKIEIVINAKEALGDTIKSMANIVASPTAGSTKKQSISTDLILDFTNPKLKNAILEAVKDKVYQKAFVEYAQILSKAVSQAVHALLGNMLGVTEKNVKVFSKSLGTMVETKDLGSEPFAKYIKSKQGAGEVGLPDPEAAIENLRNALFEVIKVKIRVSKSGVSVTCSFPKEKLIRKTPHPDTEEKGQKGAFYSWLSLVTGPDEVKTISGFSFVSVGDMKKKLRDSRSKLKTVKKASTVRSNIRLGKSLQRLMQVPRTKANAASYAGIMLSNKKTGYRSPAQIAGGSNKDYQPSKTFFGFWDIWWSQRQKELSKHISTIVAIAVKAIIKRKG